MLNDNEIEVIDKVNDIIESAELELQKALSFNKLGVEGKEIFKNVLSYTDELEKIYANISNEHIRFIVSEKIIIYFKRFLSVLNQII